MASILWIIILMMLVAVIIIAVSIIAYNKHLDKVTKGEAHDTHSAIPEPRSTASVIYKIVLMIIVILSYLGISTANGMIGGLQTRIGELDSEVNGLRFEISNLRSQIEDRDRLIRNFEYEVSDPENNLVDVTFKLWLKEFTDNTTVSIDIAGKDVVELIQMFREGTVMDPDITGDAVETEVGDKIRKIAGSRFTGQNGPAPDHAVQVKPRKSGGFACGPEIVKGGTGFGNRAEALQKFVQFVKREIGISVDGKVIRP